ncbi:unnamed protein product [Colias eurytheme]|nr:unnamed protein product [Colias eurytheme]
MLDRLEHACQATHSVYYGTLWRDHATRTAPAPAVMMAAAAQLVTQTERKSRQQSVRKDHKHGDLSKPSSNARGRISTLTLWEELIQLLNSDGSRDTKSCDKWKKVWSDFKNNTKKKAARLHRAASGTGGGPAVFAKLTDIEQLVGLQVEKAGLSQVIDMQPNLSVGNDPRLVTQQPSQSVELSQHELLEKCRLLLLLQVI